MSGPPYFARQKLDELNDVAREEGLTDRRLRLFAGIPKTFVANLPLVPYPDDQLALDLQKLNSTGVLVDGSLAFEVWLQNAARVSTDRTAVEFFQRSLSALRERLGVPALPLRMEELPELKEAVVHSNDMLPFSFLDGARRAGAAVARIDVWRHDQGLKSLRFGDPGSRGTGWLIGPRALITNHHVIAARRGGEQVSVPDFELQAQTARVQFDLDSSTATGREVKVTRVLATDADLDFTVVELETAPGPAPLQLNEAPLDVGPNTYLPVNIIQHPSGSPKQIAIRNNLATRSEGPLLRYFTDTDEGSSGSPVCDDDWRVVALHRGHQLFETTNFQGKPTAVVNVGTRMTAILEKLRSEPAVWRCIAEA